MPSRRARSRRRRPPRASTHAIPGEPANALLIGYDHRPGRRQRALALRHGHAPARRPDHEHDLAALLPARPDRQRALPGRADVRRPHQRGVLVLRAGRNARDRALADGPPDPLPDHGQFPGLPRHRRQARRRLDGHRPPLLQPDRRASTPRSTSGPATRSSRAGRRSISSATATPTRISSASPASSCS